MTTVAAQTIYNNFNNCNFSNKFGSSRNLEYSYLNASDTYVIKDKDSGLTYFANQLDSVNDNDDFSIFDGNWQIFTVDGSDNVQYQQFGFDAGGSKNAQTGEYDSSGLWQIDTSNSTVKDFNIKGAGSAYQQIGSFTLQDMDKNGVCGTYSQNGQQMNIKYNDQTGNYEIRGKSQDDLVYTCKIDGDNVIMTDAQGKQNTVQIETKSDGTYSLTDIDGVGFEHQTFSMVG